MSLEIGKDCPNVFLIFEKKKQVEEVLVPFMIMFGQSSEVTVARGI